VLDQIVLLSVMDREEGDCTKVDVSALGEGGGEGKRWHLSG
jgi:hypothetical protein